MGKRKIKGLFLNPDAIEAVDKLSFLNEDASSIDELCSSPSIGNKLEQVWKDVLSSERQSRQQHLQNEIVLKLICLRKRSTTPVSPAFLHIYSHPLNSSKSSLDPSTDFSRQASVHSQKTSKDGMEPDSFTDPSYSTAEESCFNSNILNSCACTVDSVT